MQFTLAPRPRRPSSGFRGARARASCKLRTRWPQAKLAGRCGRQVVAKVVEQPGPGGLSREPTGCLNKSEFNFYRRWPNPGRRDLLQLSACLGLRKLMYVLPSILGSERFHYEFDLTSLILLGWFGSGSKPMSGGMGWAKRSGSSRTPSTWAGAAL